MPASATARSSFAKFFGIGRPESCSGLVQHENPRTQRERTRDFDQTLVHVRQLGRETIDRSAVAYELKQCERTLRRASVLTVLSATVNRSRPR